MSRYRSRVVYSKGFGNRRRPESNASSVKMSNASSEGFKHRRIAGRPY